MYGKPILPLLFWHSSHMKEMDVIVVYTSLKAYFPSQGSELSFAPFYAIFVRKPYTPGSVHQILVKLYAHVPAFQVGLTVLHYRQL